MFELPNNFPSYIYVAALDVHWCCLGPENHLSSIHICCLRHFQKLEIKYAGVAVTTYSR